MKCNIRKTAWLMCAVFVLAASPAMTVAADNEAGWTSLFDGETLNGWARHDGTANYTVEDGCIVGRTSERSPNSFLCSRKNYGDFELKFEVKVDDALNSGVQIRSAAYSEKTKYRVHGPQVEIATNGTAGFVYGEGLGTGWLSPDEARADKTKQAAFRKGEWNEYHVKAVGNKIETSVNGVPVADLKDTKTGMLSGFIGLQVHGVKAGSGPYEVRWKNLKIREIK